MLHSKPLKGPSSEDNGAFFPCPSKTAFPFLEAHSNPSASSPLSPPAAFLTCPATSLSFPHSPHTGTEHTTGNTHFSISLPCRKFISCSLYLQGLRSLDLPTCQPQPPATPFQNVTLQNDLPAVPQDVTLVCTTPMLHSYTGWIPSVRPPSTYCGSISSVKPSLASPSPRQLPKKQWCSNPCLLVPPNLLFHVPHATLIFNFTLSSSDLF